MSDQICAALTDAGFSIVSVFVPYSHTTGALKQPYFNELSINYLVTIKHGGRDLYTTDFSFGVAHCNAYKKLTLKERAKICIADYDAIFAECEHGRNAVKPTLDCVFYHTITEYDTINYGTFEDWARNTGYDPDSRKAEKIYRACLEHALILRNAVGEDTMRKIAELFNDY